MLWCSVIRQALHLVICAQIIALIEHSDANSFTLSALQLIYQKLMPEQGHPYYHNKEPDSTQFKEHLIGLTFLKALKAKNIYIYTYATNGRWLTSLPRCMGHKFGEDNALTFMRASMMMHTFTHWLMAVFLTISSQLQSMRRWWGCVFSILRSVVH